VAGIQRRHAGHFSLDVTEQGPRARMLETIRAFVAEGLAACPDGCSPRAAAATLRGSPERGTGAYAARPAQTVTFSGGRPTSVATSHAA
jgi:hypothetical protein